MKKSDKQTANQILAIKQRISKLEGKLELPKVDAINFSRSFDTGEPLLIGYRVFPYILLMARDPGAVLLWRVAFNDLGLKKENFETSQLLLSLSSEQRQQLTQKAKYIRGEGYIPGLEEGCTIEQLKQVVCKNPLFVFSGDFSDPLASFFSLIPPAWVNAKLLDAFFKYIYPVIPIVDEQEFRSSLDIILGPVIEGQYINSFPNVPSAESLPILALFLLILRLTYLQVPNATTYAVSFDAFRAAETIMKEFNIYKSPSLPALQAEIMLRFYIIVSPEMHTQSWVTQMTVGSLVHSCYSLGLHRDPKYSRDTNPRSQNLKRRIWHVLVRFDIIDSMTFQTTLATNPEIYDTQLPDTSVTYTSEMEKKINQTFWESEELLSTLQQIVSIELQVKHDTPISLVIGLLEKADKILQKLTIEYRNLEYESAFQRVLIFLVKLFLAYMYYTIYLYKQNPLQDKYLLRALEILFVELAEFRNNCPMLSHFYTIYVHFVLMVSLCLRTRIECITSSQNGVMAQDLHECTSYLKNITYAKIRELGTLSLLQKFAWQVRNVYSNAEKVKERAGAVLTSVPDLVQKASYPLPVKEINGFLKKYIKTREIQAAKSLGETEMDLLDELQCQNFWNAMDAIQLEEMVSNTWIDRIKVVNFGLDLDFWDFFKTS